MRSAFPPATAQIASCEELRGSIRVYCLARRVILNRVEGFLSEAMAAAWMAAVEPRFVEGPLDALADWEGMTGYAAGARRVLTDWALRRQALTGYANFLVKPGIVAMGVSVATMTLSLAGIDVHSTGSRVAFEDSVRFRVAVAERDHRARTIPPP